MGRRRRKRRPCKHRRKNRLYEFDSLVFIAFIPALPRRHSVIFMS